MPANKKKNENTILKDTLALFVITLVCSALLGFVYELTRGPIEAAENKEKLEANASIFPEAKEFKTNDELSELITSEGYTKALEAAGVEKAAVIDILEVFGEGEEIIGYVMTSTSNKGYGGDITITLGVDKDGKVTGLKFLVLNETVGLGAKADEQEFKDQYKGKGGAPITLGDGDNAIQAISGATVTSRAVTNAVNAGVVLVQLINGAK